MRRFALAIAAALAGIALIAVVTGNTAEDAPATLELGSKAPMTGVKMTNVDGRAFSISDVAGEKGTLVVFTCNSCPWVKAWEDRVTAYGNTWSKKGVGVIAINPNDPDVKSEDDLDVMKARAKKLGLKFPYVVDATSDIARAFGATRTPEVFLFDAEGKLVYHGAVDDNAREPGKVKNRWLEDALKAVSAGKAVTVTDTKAFGCTIKFRSKA